MKKEKDNKELIYLATAGSVDDGKSTLIGRLLYECNAVYEDQLEAIRSAKEKNGDDSLDFSLLLDGLASEREQGITIDVAHRYFATDKRKYIIADVPGHEQYTKNMVTGASKAQVVLILADARKGLLTQSKRHLFIASLLGIRQIAVVINKMDLVDYDQEVFDKIKKDFIKYSAKLNIPNLVFIPVSALKGDNVSERGDNLSWHKGWTLLDYLENVQVSSETNLIDFRFPVQMVSRPNQDFRGYGGMVISGVVKKGEEILVLPSGQSTSIDSIIKGDKKEKQAFAGQSAMLTFKDEIDIGRGDMIVRKNNLPLVAKKFEATICWMSADSLDTKKSYILKHTTKNVRCFVDKLRYKIDIDTLHRKKTGKLNLNEIGKIIFSTNQEIFADPYIQNKNTGSFILIDEASNDTVAAGIIIRKIKGLDVVKKNQGAVLWFSGLSGSGKSTIANEVASELKRKNVGFEILDGDVLRENINYDLGFSKEDRRKNLEIAGFIANMLSKHGVIVLSAFISPYRDVRNELKEKINNFFEVYINCSLEVCEERDVKGLYKKARQGEIKDFTGIGDDYEAPKNPDLEIDTSKLSIEESVDKVLKFLADKKLL